MSAALDNLDILVPQVTSKAIEEVLNLFAAANDSLKMAQAELDYCDKKTQDMLHEIEICDQTYHERAREAIDLRKIRQRRRAAKDIIDTLTPLESWISSQANAVNLLKQCLGAMRKAEAKQDNRVYYKRACDAGDNFILLDRKK